MNNNFDPKRLSKFSFASRKIPEYMCHKLLQCKNCDLVYTDLPPDVNDLASAYHNASFDSSEEANDAASAYLSAIRPTLHKLSRRQRVLEIGTGTGIFLEHMLGEGFTEIVGVEPSSEAIAAAPKHRQAWIRNEIFEEKNFTPNFYDLVVCFMTLEHVHNPEMVANAVFRLLRPGGAFVSVTHNYRSAFNRLLGKRSPIIDIEHLQLFSDRSIKFLLTSTGYKEITVTSFKNTYSLQYWCRLAPLPMALKSTIPSIIELFGLDKAKLGMNVGNMIATGFKPG